MIARAACQLLLLPVLLCLPACQSPRPSQAEVLEVTRELGPGTFDLTDTRAGLEKLSSYQSALTVSFDGSKAGQPLKWSSTRSLQVTTSPAARLLTVETSGPSGEPEQPSLAETSGAGYEWRGGKECLAPPLELVRSKLERLEPAASLWGVLGAEEAGPETVNGVKANRYTFDERALGQAGLSKSTGELWLASDGGYVLRYRLATKGDFGEKTQGTITWEYELTRINQPLTIKLPGACPPGLVDAPMVPNADSVENDPGVLRYRAPIKVTEAAAFYRKELESLGWRSPAQPDPQVNAMQDEIRKAMAANPQAREVMKRMGLNLPALAAPPEPPSEDEAYLVFEKGGRTLRVLITRGDAATEILLLGNTGA